MKGWALIIILLAVEGSYAQENLDNPGTLKAKLIKAPADTNRVLLLCDISYSYRYRNVDSAYFFAANALDLSRLLGYKNGTAWANLLIGVTYSIRGDVPKAVSYYDECIRLAESNHNYLIVSRALANIGWCVFDLGDYHRAIDYFKRSLKYQEELIGQEGYIITLQMNLGQSYLFSDRLKEAEYYLNLALAWGEKKNPNYGYLLNMMSALRLEQKKYALADSLLKIGWVLIDSLPDKIDKADNRYYLAKLRFEQNDLPAAYENAMMASDFYQQLNSKVDLERVYKLLSAVQLKRGKMQESLRYLLESNALRDSVRNSNARYSEFLFEQREQEKQVISQQRDKELLRAEKRTQQIAWISSLIIFICIVSGLSFFVWQKQRSNRKLLLLNNELLKKEATILTHNNLLKEMNLSKDKLFSIIGHDLRSPLLSLTGFLKLLSHHSENLTKAELKQFLNDLDRSLKNLFNLLENLLQWSLSQTGTFDFKAENFDIAMSIKENVELLQDEAQSKKISIGNESDATILVKAHPHSMHTVVRNLVSNAIKFTEEGGRIVLRTERIGAHVKVSVIDSGLGIREEVVQNLFKIGFRHSTPGTAKEKGSGLGLVLCKDFVEKNGGTIGVESIEGKGSTFYFTVPIASEA